MKYFKIWIVLVLALIPAPVAADWMSLSTGAGQVQVTQISDPAASSAAAATGQAAFYGIIIKTDGTNNVTLNIYDNIAASGKKLVPTDIVVLGTARIWALSYSPAIKCLTGIYVSVSVAGGGTCTYQVLYDK